MHTRIRLLPAVRTLGAACALATASAAAAAEIGPWPTNQPYLWSTNPFAPVCGVVYQQPDYLNNLVMGNFGTGSKNPSWLPYAGLDASYSERLCIAQLVGSAASPVTNIHVRVLDQATVGKHGWAILLKDGAGKLLDFGVRPFFARGFLAPHEWNGAAWTNHAGGTAFSPQYERPRHGTDYYTVDFSQNDDGTITWSVAGLNGAAGTNFLDASGTTLTAYGPITQVYLNAATTDTTWQNYKWTEFNVSPQVFSPPPLRIALTNVGDVVLSWPAPWTTNFVLQAREDLGPAGWAAVTNPPVEDLSTISVVLPAGPGARFFRLAK